MGKFDTKKEKYSLICEKNTDLNFIKQDEFVFVIFSNGYIRYAKYSFEEDSNGSSFLGFDDYFVNKRIAETKKTVIAVSPDRYSIKNNPSDILLNYDVLYEGKVIGSIVNINKQDDHLLITIDYQSKELLIPLVQDYLSEIDNINKCIYLQNISELLQYAD